MTDTELSAPVPGQRDLPGFELVLVAGATVKDAGQGNLFGSDDDNSTGDDSGSAVVAGTRHGDMAGGAK